MISRLFRMQVGNFPYMMGYQNQCALAYF